MSKPTKLPSGNYRLRVYAGKDSNGKHIYKSFTADTPKECRRLAAEYELTNSKKKTSPMTVRDAVRQYIESIEGVSSPKTIREYLAYSRTHLQSMYDIRTSELTKNDVQAAISEEAKKYSPKSVRNYWGLVSAALKAQGIVFTDIKLPQKKKHDIVVPSESELKDIIAAVEGTQFYVPVLLACFCGLRRGEIAALDYTKDVEFEKGIITINKAMTEDKNGVWFVKDTPKTYTSNRKLKMPEIVSEAIQNDIDKGITHSIHPAFITSGFAKRMKAIGKEVRFHDLRHFYASMLLALNVPDRYAAQQMGHSSTAMLHTVYQHIMADKQNEIDARIQAHINSLN